MKRFNYKKIIPFLVLFIVISLTVGYSAFGNNMNISGIVAEVRVQKDIRVTGISINSSSGNSLSVGENYNHNWMTSNITLPQADSSVTYKVEITNIGNVEMGIYDFVGLPENLEISLENYKLKDAICDDKKCSLGVVKEFLLTVKYKENGFDSTNTSYTLNLNVDFRQMYSVTYEGIVYHNYPSKVMEGATLTVEFTEDIPKAVRAYVGSVNTNDYTYENNIVTINNVTDNLTIKYLEKVYMKQLSTNKYFKETAYRTKIKTVSFVNYVDTTGALATYDLGDTGYEGEVTGWIDSDYNLFIGSDWDIYAKSLSAAFYGMSEVTSILFNNLNTSEATSTRHMFYNCKKIVSLDLTSFDTSKVTDMSMMFSSCTGLTSLNISNFNTSNVKTMKHMFGSAKFTSIDLSSFDTSKVTDMSSMFYQCSALISLDISNFDTSLVTDMSKMFGSCFKLVSLDISNFNTSLVTDMSSMFATCRVLTTLNVSSFSTAKVTDMNQMFQNCRALTTLNLSNFSTELVTDMSSMFSGCSALTSLNISQFKTDLVTDMSSMFSGCDSLSVLDVSNFNTSKVTNMGSMFANMFSLSVLDVSNFDTSEVINMAYMFGTTSTLNDSYTILSELDLSSFDTSKVTDMSGMFMKCINLKNMDLSNFDTSQVTTMSQLFEGCNSLESLNLKINTQKVTDMSRMFWNCSSLIHLDLSFFDISSLTNTENMFTMTNSLKSLNLNNLDFYNSNITNFANMFDSIGSLVVITVMDDNNKTWVEGKLHSGRGTVVVA